MAARGKMAEACDNMKLTSIAHVYNIEIHRFAASRFGRSSRVVLLPRQHPASMHKTHRYFTNTLRNPSAVLCMWTAMCATALTRLATYRIPCGEDADSVTNVTLTIIRSRCAGCVYPDLV